jgi:hypothetical protein
MRSDNLAPGYGQDSNQNNPWLDDSNADEPYKPSNVDPDDDDLDQDDNLEDTNLDEDDLAGTDLDDEDDYSDDDLATTDIDPDEDEDSDLTANAGVNSNVNAFNANETNPNETIIPEQHQAEQEVLPEVDKKPAPRKPVYIKDMPPIDCARTGII